MSRRLSERALPDFSVLINGGTQLGLPQGETQGCVYQRPSVIAVGDGCNPSAPAVLLIGRFWVETLARVGHLAHRAGTPIPASSRIPTDASGEGGVTC